MFILKETENSDVRCGSVITNFETMDEAQQKMQELYQKTISIMGGDFGVEEDEDCCPEHQRWATTTPGTAHIQDGIDTYDWEIIEDPEWVKKEGYRSEDTGVADKNSKELFLGDKVVLLDKFAGTIIFEHGAYGVGFEQAIDWDYVIGQFISLTGRRILPSFCYNDNYVSLWELLWNFNCEDDVCVVLTKSMEE